MSALNGVRIVELAESVAGEYCGKLLADFGAEVIKVEMPGSGSPTRAMTPGSVFAYLNTNKRSVVLDVAREQDALDDLVGSARRRHRRTRIVRASGPASGCGVLRNHAVWPGCATGDAECQEHQRVP